MPLVTTSFPNLTGGVSQQPSSQRLLTQCETQENAVPLLVGGLIKRPPTNHVSELLTWAGASVDLSSSFTHFVTRDSNEEFVVSLTGVSDTVHVNELDGTKRQVFFDVGSNGYLTSSSPKTDFRAISIADVTFLVNTAKTAELKTDSADLSLYSRNLTTQPYEGLIWIKSSGQGVGFSAKVEPTGGVESTVTCIHTPVADQIGGAGSSSDPNVYGYPPNPPSTTEMAEALTIGGAVTDCSVDTLAMSIYHDKSDSATAATVEVTATTMVLIVTDGANAGTTTYTFSDAASNTVGELVTAINALDKGWVAELLDESARDSATLEVLAATDVFGLPKKRILVDSIEGLNGLTNFTAENKGSVIFVTNSAADFQLTVEDSLGQNAHKVIKDEVSDFADLPPICKNNFKVLVKGDPESEVDDYYVKFETNGGEDFGEGIWLETIGGGVAYQWNYDTMPHILIRQSDNSFYVKRADGTTPGANVPVGGDYTAFKFIPRQTGSELTNPKPSFVGRAINDITFYKNRLAILSGEDCILSEAAELFNFFRTTTTQLLDTAPIDVGVGGTEINKIGKAVPFSDSLILFSERTQFSLQGEAILSPLTASITSATNYDITTTVRPVPAGNALFFAFNRGSYSGIREFYKASSVEIDFDAVESTAQCPKYLPGTVEKMTASTHEDLLAVLSRVSTNATNEIYLYKYYKTEKGRVQSAWFKFILSGVTDIINMHFIGQSLYLVVKRGSKTFVERMDLQTGLTDTGKEYTTTVDRRTLRTGQSGFTLTLPYNIESGDTMQVVSSDGEVMTIASTGTNTITLKEEFAASESFYVGIPYTMKYELSEPVLKRVKENGGYEMIAVGRHQLRYMTIIFSETAFFNVKVTPDIGDTIEYPFTGRYLSAGGFLGSVPSESGDFRFPVFAESDSVSIIIENDSPLPSNIQSIEFEANYTSRSQPRYS